VALGAERWGEVRQRNTRSIAGRDASASVKTPQDQTSGGYVSYIKSILLPGEKVLIIGRLHWIIYRATIILTFVATAVAMLHLRYFVNAWPIAIMSYGLAVAAVVRSWFIKRCTEIAVTNLRVIYKTGFVWRRTVEMNMDMVVTVRVDQTVLGRILGYGTLHVLGAGQGIEHLHNVAQPLKVRTAIISNEGGAAERLQLGNEPLTESA
jgi:hypothetical protein